MSDASEHPVTDEPTDESRPDRWIELEGVVNMRDSGGLPTRDGGAIQPHRLLRSDNLQDLSEDDVRQIVEDLGVSDIVDLRSDTEVSTEGPGPLWHVEALTHHHHSLFGDGRSVTAEQALAMPEHSKRATRDAGFWSDHYLGYLAARPDSISAALDVVSRSTGATVIHCAAGKDRTGTVIALALDAAGVPHEAIVEDYALTGERIEKIIARLMPRELYGNALRHQSVADQLPRPETMRTILATVQSEFGGAQGWLREQGWSDADIERLVARLTS
ncbi:protein tyrosine/serine phosphatase-like protein [Janibacter sp. HTCC2649]|uniref:tyrosine-protein phosphatase n=1 Tax=Janibacter sp. HTCC2649 TaxID=313589 RepID=UPI000066EA0A|nr:tyrosine-protein phosphatase [Janibacter sp. HTCC2649]EAP99513.1 protein tyrosine/serine phosphatase-like protein [Janibacter sp. HTCC2649]